MKIVCDFDETLVSTGPIHRQSFEEITKRKISDILAKNLRGKSEIEILCELIPLEANLDILLTKRKELLCDIVISEDVKKIKKPGFDEFVAWLKIKKINCAIASNSPDEFVKIIIRNLGVDDVFSVIIGASKINIIENKRKLPRGNLAKPNPFSVNLAAKKLCQMGDIIYVGDNEVDCLTCCRGDFFGIIINVNKELVAKYPTLIFGNDLIDALEIIKKL